MLYLGIDQHRKQLTVNLRNEEGDVVLKRQVSTEWDRVRKFFEELERQAELEGGFMAIVELCGFTDWLLQMLALYGCRETLLIQPEKRSRKKTDRRDASALSNILWVNRHRVPGGATLCPVLGGQSREPDSRSGLRALPGGSVARDLVPDPRARRDDRRLGGGRDERDA